MNRIVLMVLRNIFRVPGLWTKLCHYAKNTDKYPEAEKWAHIHKIMHIACVSGNINLIVTGNKCGSFAVFYSSRCGHNHIRFIAFHQLEIDKIVLGILLVSKTEDLSVLSVETIVGSIPKAHDAAFAGQQSDGISLWIV